MIKRVFAVLAVISLVFAFSSCAKVENADEEISNDGAQPTVGYSVKKTPTDENPIGVFEYFNDAKNLADRKGTDYKVYDRNNTPVYTPIGNSGMEIMYTVRQSAADESSQIGMFIDFENAKALADTYKNEGYMVYDMSGNLVYAPYIPPAIADTNEARYRVRKSANDSDSQIGAFAEYENAVKKADERRNEGYKVYDLDGNLVYAPYIPSANENANSDGIRYRVRKSANDSDSQIGAFAEYENAVKKANERKADGYEVYDMNGNLVYTP